MRKYLMLLLLVLVFCGADFAATHHQTNPTNYRSDVKDPKIDAFVEEFIKDFSDIAPKKKLDKDNLLSYRYESLPDNILGVCTYYFLAKNEVQISPIYYNSYHTQKAIIYHELGHCLLDLDHDESHKSMMRPYLSTDETYWKENWEQELKKFKEYYKKNK